jgi:hypothetical protein
VFYSGNFFSKVWIPGAPKPDVRVRIPRRIVQIQRENSSVGTIIPIATTQKPTQQLDFIPS